MYYMALCGAQWCQMPHSGKKWIDKPLNSDYTKYRKKVLPETVSPYNLLDVIAVLCQGAGGHFFFAVKNRPIIPTMRIPS